jgi:hypothetical protein
MSTMLKSAYGPQKLSSNINCLPGKRKTSDILEDYIDKLKTDVIPPSFVTFSTLTIPFKSCMPDPWHTFLFKDTIDIFHHNNCQPIT